LPIRENEWVTPCAKPHCPRGIQAAIARVAVGNAAPSPKPKASRTRTSAVSPPTAPVSAVQYGIFGRVPRAHLKPPARFRP
jgi:hypothetical protein